MQTKSPIICIFLLISMQGFSIGMPTPDDFKNFGKALRSFGSQSPHKLLRHKTVPTNTPFGFKKLKISNTLYNILIPNNWQLQQSDPENSTYIFSPQSTLYPSLTIAILKSNGKSLRGQYHYWLNQLSSYSPITLAFQIITKNKLKISYTHIKYRLYTRNYAHAMRVSRILTANKTLSITYLNQESNMNAYIRNQYMTSLSSLQLDQSGGLS